MIDEHAHLQPEAEALGEDSEGGSAPVVPGATLPLKRSSPQEARRGILDKPGGSRRARLLHCHYEGRTAAGGAIRLSGQKSEPAGHPHAGTHGRRGDRAPHLPAGCPGPQREGQPRQVRDAQWLQDDPGRTASELAAHRRPRGPTCSYRGNQEGRCGGEPGHLRRGAVGRLELARDKRARGQDGAPGMGERGAGGPGRSTWFSTATSWRNCRSTVPWSGSAIS